MMAKVVRIGPEPEECEVIEGQTICEVKSETLVNFHSESDIFLGHAYLVVISAILSLALTQTVKPFIWKNYTEKSDAVVRLFAVLTGAMIAYTLSDPFEMIDVYLGASAGALNAFVIKMFKAKVKKSLGVDETPNAEEEE
jgi:hypothetical protein